LAIFLVFYGFRVTDDVGKPAKVRRSFRIAAYEAAEKLGALKGHGFSRAVSAAKSTGL
jgi:hypothetical protein